MRNKSIEVQIGSVKIGGNNPVAIQSMTNTLTADVDATYQQIVELIQAGSELVRITVNDQEAAKAVPHIKKRLLKNGFQQPIIGDFHYNGHALLTNFPDCAKALDKYRINPGNVGSTHAIRGGASAHDYNFRTMIECALKYNKPVRIGVNWGSLDQELLTRLMDKNARSKTPKTAKEILYEAMVESALDSSRMAEKIGLPKNKIVLSVKMSGVQDVINVYQLLARRCNHVLHLGLTEAGMGAKGLIASSAALAVLLQQGIGDTIRISLTPEPADPAVPQKSPPKSSRPHHKAAAAAVATDLSFSSRTKEVEACQLLLQTMGMRNFRPQVSSCPGCGRTSNDFYQKLAKEVNDHIAKKMPLWRKKYPGVESLHIAVMGCIVNGPGESKHADIGISLPGKTEDPIAPVYIEGRQHKVLKGQKIPQEFITILESYISERFRK